MSGSGTAAGEWRQTVNGASNRFAPDGLDRHGAKLRSAMPLLAALFAAFAAQLFLDGDTGWHLAAGRWILANGDVPLTDPLSHTYAGAPWTAHEWLAEVTMVGAERAAGWSGLVLLFAGAFAATIWIIAREAFRFLPARYALMAMIVSGGLLVNFALARPHMLAWPLLAGWTVILLRARDRGEAPPLAAALLMLVWANLHASYIFAFGLAGLFGLEALIAHPRDRVRIGRWLLFGLVTFAAALATPLGPAHLLYPFQVSGMEALSIIGEWRRSTPDKDFLFFGCLAGLVALVALRWRTAPPLRLLLLAGLSGMALLHARHQMLFAIVGLLVVLPMLNPGGVPREIGRTPRWLGPSLFLVALLRLAVPFHFPDSASYPLTLLSQVPAEVRARPVFNEYGQGGPLAMIGVRPYIDGRADMYGDAFTARNLAVANGDIGAFREEVARFDIGWVVLRRENGLVAPLDREPGWRRLGADEHAVVFARTR